MGVVHLRYKTIISAPCAEMGTCGTEDALPAPFDKSDRPAAHTIEPGVRPAYQMNNCASARPLNVPIQVDSVALIHEAHSNLNRGDFTILGLVSASESIIPCEYMYLE